MAEDNSVQMGRVGKVPPAFDKIPFMVSVEEGTALVARDAWGGSVPWSRHMTEAERRQALANLRPGQTVPSDIFQGYKVLREGRHLYVPWLIDDFVGTVPLVPTQQEFEPIELNVANSLGVGFDVKYQMVVGEINWNWLLVPVEEARSRNLWMTEVAEFDRLSAREKARRRGRIRVRNPVQPFNPADPYICNDPAIIRAALRAPDMWKEARTALTSALVEAALNLGINNVSPRDVVGWLNRPPVPANPGRLPIARRGDTNRSELAEQATVLADESLHRMGTLVFDVRVQGIILPDGIRIPLEQEQAAEALERASTARAKALAKTLRASGMSALPANAGPLDRAAQAYLVGEALKSMDAQSGVVRGSSPIVSVGDVMSGNAVGGPGGGSPKGAPDGKKSGGRGGPKNR